MVKIELEEVSGSNGAAYQGPLVNGVRLLENIIPFNFNSATDNTSYAYTLYKNDGTTEIPFGTGEWVIDHNSGVITFYDLSGISGVASGTPPKITFYKYVGTIGARKIGLPTTGTFSTDRRTNVAEISSSDLILSAEILDDIGKINSKFPSPAA